MLKIKLDKETVYGLCNSLNACLHGIRETYPQAADYMLRAEGTIFALYDKANERKVILVSDIDPMMPSYNVVDEHGRTIGEKSELFGYLKPQYTKDGRPLQGGKWTFDSRQYKADPPWFKFEVVRIDKLGGGIAIHARPITQRRTNSESK